MRNIVPEEPIRILLVAPNETWWAELYMHLSCNHFTLLGKINKVMAALTVLRETQLDMVLIDNCLLGPNISSFCQEIRDCCPLVNIILVTEHQQTQQQLALQVGIVGCIPRNIFLTDWPALLRYINAGGMCFNQMVIRPIMSASDSINTEPDVITVGPLRIDPNRRRVTLAGQRVLLTRREFDLLICLARNAGQVVTFDQLLDQVWHYGPEAGSPAHVRLYITRLRRKLGDDPHCPQFILTERGVGYRLRSSAQWYRSGLI